MPLGQSKIQIRGVVCDECGAEVVEIELRPDPDSEQKPAPLLATNVPCGHRWIW